MATQNVLNNKIFSGRGDIALTGVKFVNTTSFNMINGTTDIYTCPAGKRAAIYNYSGQNNNGTSQTIQVKIKVSGTYYPLIINSTMTANASGIAQPNCIILEAGESISATTNAANITYVGCAMEYDASCAMYTSKVLNLTSGNNTIYTCPAGKKAVLLDNKLTTYGISSTPASVKLYNGSGGAVVHQVYLVNSGGSPATTNQFFSNTGTASAALLTVSLPAGLQAGDFVSVNSASATAGQFCWINVMETT